MTQVATSPAGVTTCPASATDMTEHAKDDVHKGGKKPPPHPPPPVISCRIRSEWTAEQSGKAFPLNQVSDLTHLTSDDDGLTGEDAYPAGTTTTCPAGANTRRAGDAVRVEQGTDLSHMYGAEE